MSVNRFLVNSTLPAPMNAILIWALPLHFAGLFHTRAGDVLNEAALEDDEHEQRLPIMPVESA
jgi:hypothetical protein